MRLGVAEPPACCDFPLHIAIKTDADASVVQELVRLWPDAIAEIESADGGYSLHTLIDSAATTTALSSAGLLGFASNATVLQLRREIEARTATTKRAHAKCAVAYVLVAAGAKLNDNSVLNQAGRTPIDHLSHQVLSTVVSSNNITNAPFSPKLTLHRHLEFTFREIVQFQTECVAPRRR